MSPTPVPADQAPVRRALARAGLALLERLPVPLPAARVLMLAENAVGNARGGWARLRAPSEAARYAAVRAAVERYAPDGRVLDVGCSQGVLQEGLRYRRYVGIDSSPAGLERAGHKAGPRTRFVRADARSYVPDEPPDAVVFNEVLYYVPRPVRVVERYAGLLAPGGVVVVSCYARSWPTRQLLRRLTNRLELVESKRVVAEPHAWDVAVLRPAQAC